jgi:uncharacterized protein (TIGR02466 family)
MLEAQKIYREDFFINPIYVVHKPEWLKKLNKYSDPFILESKKNGKKEIDERNNKFGNKKDFAHVFHSSTLNNQKGFEELQNFVGFTAGSILDEQGFDLSNYEMVMSEFWVQEFPKSGGGHHTLHTHWNGHISGFYFLKCSERTSFPVFQDPRYGRQMNLLPEKDKEKLTLASSEVNFKVKPGTILFFNSHLPHLFTVDCGYEPFRFIHWNVSAVSKEILELSNKK